MSWKRDSLMVRLLVGVCCVMAAVACSPDKKTTTPSNVKQGTAQKADAKKNSNASKASKDNPAKSTRPKKVAADLGGSGGWPMFRGNRRRTGSADVAGPREAKLQWVFRTKGRIYADAAVTKDGKTIYVASHDHFLYAVDTEGRKKWSFDTGGKIWTSPAISDNGDVYVGSDEDALFSVSADGKMNWKFVTTEAQKKGEPKPEAGRYDVDTSPLILDDGTIVFGCHLNLIALRPAAGDLRWAFAAGTGRAKVFSSVAQSLDGTLFFGTQGNFFFALNQVSEVQWHIETEGDNDSTPVVDLDGNVYFASDDGVVRSVAPGNKIRWTLDVEAPVRAPLGLSSSGVLYVPTYGQAPFVAAVDAETGAEKWRFRVEAGVGDFYGIQSGVITDAKGYAYFGGRDGYVYCVSPDGQLVWKHKTDDQVDASPVLGPNGTLYVGSDDGRLYAFSR
ncbi:MAG: PQQ-like beta-propeller repeat protein [Deltaproteobacteria bacterium]|nr:PQQ-like beta-propeller repeat protein [Deltaproteobacteria bacterium]MBN2673480.1 PQQ-like beta-propeller repeat protein [Deltaproteobacteria bacterium]